MKKKHWIWAGVAGVPALLALFVLWQLDLPHWQKLDLERLYGVRQTTLVYDGAGEAMGTLYGSENRHVVPLSEVPQHVQAAFIAAEDLRFYQHHGVDVWRVFGALWQDIKSLSFKQGASTITQQLIKLTHLSSAKTLSRKAQEAVLALQLERNLSKEEILERYLNVVYFGKGAYGIEAAARAYFDKPAAELTLAEGALLAGVVKAPSNYAPHLNPARAVARRDSILATMAGHGFITEAEAEAARAEPLHLAAIADPEDARPAAWYLDEALAEAARCLSLPAEAVLSGGYRVYTGYDPALQAAALELSAAPDSFPPDAADGTPVQAAFVALRPADGEVAALVGGRSYDVQRGLNRATQIARQPGSAFKPISTYAAAIDAFGYVPSSFADDTQRAFADGYAPRNAGDTYNGLVTLREALARSLNVATVDLAANIGLQSVRGYAERFGIELGADDANLSLALGSLTYGVSPARLCAAYGALANGGAAVEPHLIRLIEDANGQEVYRFAPPKRRAVRPETAYLLTDMLKTAAKTGSARALSGPAFPIAAKTGTVSMDSGGNRDAWTAAYTPDLAVCVWMGFDNPDSEHALASGTGGSSYPARLAAAFFGKIADRLAREDFVRPAGLRTAILDRLALEQLNAVALATANTPADYTVQELFFANALPRAVSDLWDAPQRVYDLRLESEPGETPVLSFTALDGNADYLLLRRTAEQTDLAGTLRGEAGSRLRIADMAASPNEVHEYTIIPRHRLLYEEGILLTGEESAAVSYRPGGVLNRLTEYFAPEPAAEEDSEEVPAERNQSIFG